MGVKVKEFVERWMGQPVKFTKVLERKSKYETRRPTRYWWEAVDCQPDVGWVVGLRWLSQGASSWEGYEEGRVWTPDGPSTPAALVARWPTQKPVHVPLDALELFEGTITSPHVRSGGWPKAWREVQAKEMASWPRDEKGRWLKYGGH